MKFLDTFAFFEQLTRHQIIALHISRVEPCAIVDWGLPANLLDELLVKYHGRKTVSHDHLPNVGYLASDAFSGTDLVRVALDDALTHFPRLVPCHLQVARQHGYLEVADLVLWYDALVISRKGNQVAARFDAASSPIGEDTRRLGRCHVDVVV